MNDYNNYDNFGYKPPKKKSRAFTYISLVLVTSIVSSLAVGGILYGRFSQDIKRLEQEALNAPAVAEETVAGQTVDGGNIYI